MIVQALTDSKTIDSTQDQPVSQTLTYDEFMLNPTDTRVVKSVQAHAKTMYMSRQSKTIEQTKNKCGDSFYDVQSFTSFNNPLPIYPRTKGCFDFASQTKRPEFQLVNAHEHRF